MKPTILLSLLFCAVAQAQMPPALVNAERAKILEGVKSVPKSGAPGPIGIWGQIAFPILSAPDKDGVEIAVAAAAGFQKGRFILFGHNSYLNGGEGGDHAKLMENCVKWVGNKEKPRVGLKGVNAVNFYKQRGFNAESFTTVDKKSLGDYDVVIINIQGVTSAEEGAAIADYIQGGGGFIGGMTGWAFGQTSGGKDLALSHGVNQALMPAGIAITDMSTLRTLTVHERLRRHQRDQEAARRRTGAHRGADETGYERDSNRHGRATARSKQLEERRGRRARQRWL